MTIREFAAICGVSSSTASRFFSGQGTLSAVTRARIETQVGITGYVPPASYRSRRKCSETIVLILPDLLHTFFTDAAEIITQMAVQQGKRVAILLLDLETPQTTLRHVRMLEPRGVILFNESQDDPVAEALSDGNIPVVVCGATAMGRHMSAIHIDDMLAAYDGMCHLISLGHREIGVISDDIRSISSGFQRLTGCQKAMTASGMTLEDSHVIPGGTSFDEGYASMGVLLSQAPELTAVFAFSDDVAAGVMVYLNDIGKRVPQDISVMGFDDSSVGQRIRPRLTTVHQSIDDIARVSLDRVLTSKGAHDIASLVLPYQIVERESCARLI